MGDPREIFLRWCKDQNTNAALAELSNEVTLQPDRAEAWYYRGSVRFAARELAGAQSDFDRAIALAPDFGSAYLSRGLLARGLGAHDRALADFDRALALAPGDVALLRHRGITRADLKDMRGALSDFDKALAIAPGDAETLECRARVKQRGRGDWGTKAMGVAIAIVFFVGGSFSIHLIRGGPGTHPDPGAAEITKDRPPEVCAYKECRRPAPKQFDLAVGSSETRYKGGARQESTHSVSDVRCGLCDEHARFHLEHRWPDHPAAYWIMNLCVMCLVLFVVAGAYGYFAK